MEWVLIFWIGSSSSGGAGTATFYDKPACEQAAKAIKDDVGWLYPYKRTVCVPRASEPQRDLEGKLKQ